MHQQKLQRQAGATKMAVWSVRYHGRVTFMLDHTLTMEIFMDFICILQAGAFQHHGRLIRWREPQATVMMN